MCQKQLGFTLMELMITVAIVGILAGIAYPSYSEFVVQSNRAEAQSELLKFANLQEQYFVDHRKYTTNLVLLGANESPFTTESGNYKITSVADSSTFTLTATALSTQLNRDEPCTTFTVTETGQKAAESTDCWEK